MIEIQPCNQALFIGPLPAPNNMGVCFSLSIHWLANDCEDVMFQSVADGALAAYGPGSANRLNQMQNAGNMMAGGGITLQTLVAMAQALYSNINQVVPVPANVLSFGNLFASFTLALYDESIVWLQNPLVAGDRGHVVAYNRRSGRFYDANNGSYNEEVDLHSEMASFIVHEYENTYTHFQVFSLDIH